MSRCGVTASDQRPCPTPEETCPTEESGGAQTATSTRRLSAVRPGQARALPAEAGTSRRMPPTANPRRRAHPGRRSGHTARSSGRSGLGTRRGAAGPSGIHAGAMQVPPRASTVRASPSSTTFSSARAATSERRKEKYLTSAPAHATDAANPRPAAPTDHGPTPTHPSRWRGRRGKRRTTRRRHRSRIPRSMTDLLCVQASRFFPCRQ